jgi:hypothetical protein
MAQQTAVEWLIEELGEYFPYEIGGIHLMVNKAKAMEKRQMEELALYIYEYSVTCLEERINPDGKKKFEQYYKETYNNSNHLK